MTKKEIIRSICVILEQLDERQLNMILHFVRRFL